MRWVTLPLLLAMLLPGFLAQADEIYRTVDEHGNVVFTDTPSPRQRETAERVKVNPPNTFTTSGDTVSSGGLTPFRNGDDGDHYRLLISAPQNAQTVRSNDGSVVIETSVTPGLRRNHRLVLVLDGQALAVEPDGTTWHLSNLDRGTHEVVLQVVDPNQSGAVARSPHSVFHLQRATVARPGP